MPEVFLVHGPEKEKRRTEKGGERKKIIRNRHEFEAKMRGAAEGMELKSTQRSPKRIHSWEWLWRAAQGRKRTRRSVSKHDAKMGGEEKKKNSAEQ